MSPADRLAALELSRRVREAAKGSAFPSDAEQLAHYLLDMNSALQDARDTLEEFKAKGLDRGFADEIDRAAQRLERVRCISEAKNIGRHMRVVVAQQKGAC